MIKQHDFEPKWMSPPGETIRQALEFQGRSQVWLQTQLGKSATFVKELLLGEIVIDPKLAIQLSKSLGASDGFWLKREEKYREQLKKYLNKDADLVSQIPFGELYRLGWFPKIGSPKEKLEAVLQFFNIKNPSEWLGKYQNVRSCYVFRTSLSLESNPVSVSIWLRKAEIEAEKLDCAFWDANSFLESLTEIRKLTRQKDPVIFLPLLQKICASSGVKLVVVQSISGCKASGASRVIHDEKIAMIILSARYLTDDHFWFTFFHEAAHLILHKNTQLIIDFNNSTIDTDNPEWEHQANEFAQEILIPKTVHNELVNSNKSHKKLIEVAQKLGISPGIIVGQLQFKGLIKQNWLNKLKRRYTWDNGKLVLNKSI